MFLYVIGILLALALAALLWQQRKSSPKWQRQFTFFVDLLALSATAIVVGVLAMVQLATPPTAGAPEDGLVSAPANATVEPLPGVDDVTPEVVDEVVPTEGAPQATATRRATATPRRTATARPTVERTAEATESSDATETPEATETAEPTATAEATATAEPTVTPAPTATVGNRTHTVESGDTLIEIAREYNVSVNAILAANPGMDADSLSLGQELVIPPPGSDAPPPSAPAPTTTTYTVREGDTLGSIARDLGTTTAELQRLNPGINPDSLRIGQVLIVPR